MSPEEERFMKLVKWPAILTRQQTAWVLGLQVHEISELMRKRLLRPLGEPAANGVKFFATVEIEELGVNRRWLARARKAIQEHWRQKNGPEIPSLDLTPIPQPFLRTLPQGTYPSPTPSSPNAADCLQDKPRSKRTKKS